MPSPHQPPSQAALIIILAIISAQNLLATNIMVPGLPAATLQLSASSDFASITLAAFFATYASSLLVYGPLSDRYGRRSPLLWSLVIYFVGSVMCAAAQSATILITGRILQGIGAGGGTVVAFAAARDSFEGPRLVKATSYINAGRSLAPALAPMIGGLLVDASGWRATFIATSLFALVLGIYCFLFFLETNKNRSPLLSLRHTLENYKSLFQSRRFLAVSIAGALSLGTWFAFLAGSPAIFIEQMGISPSKYGIYPAIMVFGSFLGGAVTARLSSVWGNGRLIAIGLCVLFLSSITTMLFPLVGIVSIETIVAPMAFVSLGYGMVFPAAAAEGMQMFRAQAGTAFAFIGFSSMLIAAASSSLVGMLPGPPALVFSAVMVGWSIAAIVAFASAPGRQPADHPAVHRA